MAAPTKICAECGASLSADSPQGLCPQCLLRRGLEETPTLIASAEASASSESPITNHQSPIANPKVHYFGDYELLEEIARGGMGVVYKARQISLNRAVALKMILAGQFATEAEVKRFRVEAEAAANLQHPNIVAIHEVGEHEGRHYFSMDYVAGKNLAEFAGGKPLPTKQAASLVKTIAEAVHYAHQRGTLHRDLKPQNVLLDEQGGPRITDFGLAKRTQEESGLTRSGAVMGSPSYMPPEQAAGRLAELGPHSDVYSLGAILYEMLTGRVPFKRETPTATLVQVLEEEPVAPRKLNPGVPMDLETICLKCLEKRSERRYASARALAEELERFLNHEPILARPASRMRKGWSWLRKHPWAITGMAAVIIMGLVCAAYGMWEHGRFLLWQAAHPETVFRPGFQPLLITGWLGLMLFVWPCGWAELRLRHYFRRHRELGTPIPDAIVRASIGLGSVVIIYCLALVIKQVEAWAWWPRHDLAGVAFSLLPVAMGTLVGGAVLVWKAVGASELSAFSELVARTMEAADARDEQLANLRARRKSLKERLLRLIILPTWFALTCAVIVFSGGIAKAADEPDVHSMKIVVWVAGIATWLLPALLLSPWRGEELSRQVVRRRAVVASVALLGAWVANAPAIGWLLGLALTLGGGSLGLFVAVAVSWTRQVEAQEKPQMAGGGRKEPSLFADMFRFDSGQFSAGAAVITAAFTIFIGFATFQLWRNAAAAFAYLDELSASGKVLPRQSYSLPRIPDEVNFVKTPLLQAIGTRTRLDTNRWARFVTFETLADTKGTFRLQPGAALTTLPDKTNVAWLGRNAQAVEVLRSLAPLEADLEELRQAAARTFAQVDPAALDASLQDSNRPHSPAYRLLAQLFLVHAAAELQLNHADAAWRDLRVVQRLADALTGNRRLDSTMLRVAVVQSCLEGFLEGWVTGRWTQGNLQQWESWLATVDLLRDLDCSLRGEEPRVLNSVFDEPSANLQSFAIIPFSWVWFRSQRLYNQLLFGYCDAAFDAVRQQVHPARTDAFQAQAARSLKENSTPWRVVYYDHPNLDPVLPKLAYVQTLVNLSRVAGALTRHRADTGKYPSTLEELAPRCLPKVPHDLIGGKPLVYRRTTEDRFSLYSVGWNERDDGGTAPETPLDLRHGDWVWHGAAKSGE